MTEPAPLPEGPATWMMPLWGSIRPRQETALVFCQA